MFVHASIRTSNMEKSLEFYTQLLGMKLVSRRLIPQNKAEIALLQNAEETGGQLELTFYQNQKQFMQAEYEERVFDHLGFEVKDMDATLSVMRQAGITITDEPFRLSPTGSLIAFVEDPNGTLIELIQRYKSSPSS